MDHDPNVQKITLEPIQRTPAPFQSNKNLPIRQPPRKMSPRPYRAKPSFRGVKKSQPPSAMKSILLQCLVCVMICLMVLGIRALDLPVGQELVDGLKFVVATDAEIVQDGRQQVDEWMGQAVEVFANIQDIDFMLPMSGSPIETTQGLAYAGPGAVMAVADGTVFYKGTQEDGTPYLRLRHSDGYESVYEGFEASVEVGQELRRGDSLGKLPDGATLIFSLTQNGSSVDVLTRVKP